MVMIMDRKKLAIILPCNKYAKVGNYFLGSYWKEARAIIPRNERVIYAAVDCIPLKHPINVINDCIVSEDEMWRVKGFDEPPEWDNRLPECIKKGFLRLIRWYNPEKIVILLNVKPYFQAVKIVLDEIAKIVEEKEEHRFYYARYFLGFIEIELYYIAGLPGKFRALIRSVLSKYVKLIQR